MGKENKTNKKTPCSHIPYIPIYHYLATKHDACNAEECQLPLPPVFLVYMNVKVSKFLGLALHSEHLLISLTSVLPYLSKQRVVFLCMLDIADLKFPTQLPTLQFSCPGPTKFKRRDNNQLKETRMCYVQG